MNLKELFVANSLPVLQNQVFDNIDQALNCPTGDINLVQDLETGLIYNYKFDPEKMIYDESYQNEQAHSKVFKSHLDIVEGIITENIVSSYGGINHCKLIEIGCGKAYFLNTLLSKGYNIVGVDPAYEGSDQRIIKNYFSKDLGLSGDGIILRHTLEHIVDPYHFLSLISEGNSNQGLIYIEVPCFEWICERKTWFDIFYEHVNYFRLSDLRTMFTRVIDSGHIFDQQYIYIVADLSTLKNPQMTQDRDIQPLNNFWNSLNSAAKISKNYKKNVIWGASSKGVIFSTHMKNIGIHIDFAIDINPEKQGKFLAKSGVQVFSPLEAEKFLNPSDNIFVMNSNYLDEIKEQSQNKYTYSVVDYD
jgi:hypothetical protein